MNIYQKLNDKIKELENIIINQWGEKNVPHLQYHIN